MGMHIQIVYSNVGSVANPQAKILGVGFIYEDQQTITYTVSSNKQWHIYSKFLLQSNLSYVTFQGNIEIWSLNTGLIDMKCIVKGNKN